MTLAVYLGIFFSSIIGLNIAGISLNKIALIPFEAILLIKILINHKKRNPFIYDQQLHLLVWYYVLCISSIIGVIFISENSPFLLNDTLVKIFLQVAQVLLFYIPITISLSYFEDSEFLYNTIKNGFIFTVRIQAVWAFLQMFLYYITDFDINRIVMEFFSVNSDTPWTVMHNIGGLILLRPTGLNRDAAFLGILMVIGIIFEKSKIWKTLFFLVTIISFSRSAFLTLIIYNLYLVLNSKHRMDFSFRNIIYYTIAFCSIIFIYQNSPILSTQIDRMIERLATIFTGEDGTSRHSNYPLVAIKIMISHMPVYCLPFGIGISTSGVGFNVFRDYINEFYLNPSMINSVWTIECDFASVLLGSGIIGLTIYYLFYLRAFLKTNDSDIKGIVICLIIYGFMYNFATITFVQFIFWLFVLGELKLKNFELRRDYESGNSNIKL